MDERSKQLALRIIAIAYFLTIITMQGILLYRQFVLGEALERFEPIAVIVTVNSLFLISALLYFGAVIVRRLKVKQLLLIYLVFGILGTLFTWAKYNVFGNAGLSAAQLFDKLLAVYAVLGIILGFFILFAALGKRRLEKEIE